MAQNDVIDKSNPEALKKIIEKEAEFDEEEAYFELCEIIEMARQTGNYTRFQNDLNQWKKHYPIELFSDKYKSKIKYMLSEEFLDSILKNYLAFVKYSALDPNKQLEKFRKIFSRAEQHKDSKKLDKDLEAFYKEYPLEYLKEKFPHIVARLTSRSNREKILEKFDSQDAYEEFLAVIYNLDDVETFAELEYSLKPLKEKYPLQDFSEEYRSKLEPLLEESSLKQILEKSKENVTSDLDIADLDNGTIITLEDEKALTHTSGTLSQKSAYFELLEIMKNPNDTNSIFNWAYKYMKYVNMFDDYHKGLILSTLTPYYKIPKQKDYRIPAMDSKSNDYLSFSEYNSIDDIKTQAILQYLAIISTTGTLTNDDIENLDTIHKNSIKAQAVDLVSSSLDLFEERVGDNTLKLTLSDPEYFGEKPNASGSSSGGISIPQTEEVKKRNNNSSSNSSGGGVSISLVEEPERLPNQSDFVVADDEEALETNSNKETTSIFINYNNGELGNNSSVDIEIAKSAKVEKSMDNNSANADSSASDENSAYKVIPFENDENNSDLERNRSSVHTPTINQEVTLEEDNKESNDINNTDKKTIPDQDRIQDFSTFARKKDIEDSEIEL